LHRLTVRSLPLLALLSLGPACAPGPMQSPDASELDAASMDASLDARGRPDTGVCVDNDNDGHPSAACGGDDCDDNNPRINPGIREFCDNRGVDEDCDPCTVAEVTPSGFGGDGDRDEDRFVSTGCFNRLSPGAAMPACASARPDAGADAGESVGYITVSAAEVRGADCADDPAAGGGSRFPGALEVCNGVDDNCVNGTMDEARVPYFRDSDGDGFGDRAAIGADLVMACAPPFGFSRLGTDCDDANAMINPAAREVCDALGNVDENCNGSRDEGCGCPRVAESRSCCSGRGVEVCTATGMGSVWGACTAEVRGELCNRIDDDCDGSADEGLTILCYPDGDDDGYAAMGAALEPVCPDASRMSVGQCPLRYTNRAPSGGASTDCNDGLATRNPARDELCNGVDDDCDDSTADGIEDRVVGTSCSVMAGVGRCGTGSNACVSGAIQCRANAAVAETCNGADDDCDGLTDEGLCVDSASSPTGAGMCISGGECSMGRCFDGRGDCDANNRNGCEADLTADPNHCGACGVRCLSGACERGRCVGSSIVAIAGGAANTCVLLATGRVACWGSNAHGQLGIGNTTRSSRFEVVSSLTDAVGLSVGSDFACAVRRTGQAVCWGSNLSGRLGAGTMETLSSVPVSVLGLSNVVEVSAGPSFACARLSSGSVACWGSNTAGQLGDGTTLARSSAVTVAGLTDAVELAAASNHACARRANGQVVCWGSGYLGNGTMAGPSGVVTVSGLTDAVELAAHAQSTCARRASGAIVCWGANTNGQLGDGTTRVAHAPVAVATITDAAEIAMASTHACARRAGGAIWCWGSNGIGQLGDGTITDRPAPVASLVSAARLLSAANLTTCAVDTAGLVLCWGHNHAGQVGDGTTNARRTPTEVNGQTDVTAVALGATNTCARLANGALSCWGQNHVGQLSLGARGEMMPVTRVPMLSDAASVAMSGTHTCVTTTAGTVLCTGANDNGQLGDRTTLARNNFVSVVGLTDVAEVGVGANHSCARLTTGAVRCWGANGLRQLGDGTTTDRWESVAVVGINDAVQLSVGGDHACAALGGGGVRCWGANGRGQLGNGAVMLSGAPGAVQGLSEVVQVSAGDMHACARRGNGEVWCWGDNEFGQLGDNTVGSRNTPTRSMLPTAAVFVAAANNHTCARLASGAIACFGQNNVGQIGDGTSTSRRAPVLVSGVTDAAQLDVAGSHSCALRTSGVVSCWGSNGNGQLGDSTTMNRTTPVDVRGL
jgi:alpha-tubulin suppressor-like RCC1 family protein